MTSHPDTGAVTPPRTARGRRTRERLLSTAAVVFGEFGYHEASIAEICRRADVGLGTVYGHFSGKLQIFLELCRQRHLLLEERLAEGTGDGVGIATRAYMDWVAENPGLYRAMRSAAYVEDSLPRRAGELLHDALIAAGGSLPEDDRERIRWSVMGAADSIAYAAPAPSGAATNGAADENGTTNGAANGNGHGSAPDVERILRAVLADPATVIAS